MDMQILDQNHLSYIHDQHKYHKNREIGECNNSNCKLILEEMHITSLTNLPNNLLISNVKRINEYLCQYLWRFKHVGIKNLFKGIPAFLC